MTVLGYTPDLWLAEITVGLVNGCFFALLSLGLAIIFGLLRVVNFAHGAFFLLGAYGAWSLERIAGLGYWWSLLLAPFALGIIGCAIEVLLVRRLYRMDPLYSLLLTYGLALVVTGIFTRFYGVAGQSYTTPYVLAGAWDLGFMELPIYRAWVIFAALTVCAATWIGLERTKIGALLRASTESPKLVQTFGINVPRLVTLAFGVGVALAALAGVLAAPLTQISPLMGDNIIVTLFAVVVIGGMGSILGSIFTGILLGVVQSMTVVLYPSASDVVIFAVMAAVLFVRPSGLFGRGQ